MEKVLYIIAGANGSGKSTLASELLPEENLAFLNADEIAKEICPENIESVRISAGKKLYKRLDAFFDKGISFAIESTLSGSNYIKTINKAKELGYNVIIIYLYLNNPYLCINRIKTRVLKGGHHIPNEDVIRRYYRSKANFYNKYKSLANEWCIFNNSSHQLALKSHNSCKLADKIIKIGNKAVKKAQEENKLYKTSLESIKKGIGRICSR